MIVICAVGSGEWWQTRLWPE